MRPIRMGVVGCGEIAQVMHLPFLSELPQFEVTAVCDLSQNLLDRVGTMYGVRHRTHDYMDILPHVDAVAILTPNHVDVAMAAAHAGKHVFVEKPLGFSPAECDEILDAVRENDVLLMVGYMKRFDPGYVYALERIRRLTGVNLIRMHDFAGSFRTHQDVYTLVPGDDVDPQEREKLTQRVNTAMLTALGSEHGHLLKTYYLALMSGIHDLTVLRGAFGQAKAVLYGSPLGEVGLVSVLDYGGGRCCVYELDMHSNLVRWDQNLTVYGQDGVVSLEFPNPYIRYAPSIVTVTYNDGSAPATQQAPVSCDEAFRREWQHFATCVEHGSVPLTNGQDARADVELALAVVQALPRSTTEQQVPSYSHSAE